MQAGFIGLGMLGSAIARRMIEQGVALRVWNRTRAKAEALGAPVAASPAALLSETPIVFLCLRDSDAVASVLHGPAGLLHGAGGGRLIVDLTTNHFSPVVGFHAAARERGAAYLEAPVLGSVVPASQGALTILVSGGEAAGETARPYLERIARRIFFLGEEGLATRMKLVNNLVLGTFMATLAEALVYGEAIGLERERVLEILAAGAGESAVLRAKTRKLIEGDFAPHFSAGLIYKDLHILQDLARALRKPLLTGSATKEIFARVLEQGREADDLSVVYEILRGAPVTPAAGSPGAAPGRSPRPDAS
jgi:3-hydroxyisobutyrate dehydrogenase